MLINRFFRLKILRQFTKKNRIFSQIKFINIERRKFFQIVTYGLAAH